MNNYLFAYGTLQPGYAPIEIAPLVQRLHLVGKGSARGSLYDFGPYPGAVLDPSSPRWIFGTVFELPDDEGFLSRLDEYEEFDTNAPDASQFIRTSSLVEMTDGRTLHCWIYVYSRDPGSAPLVESGIYTPKESCL